METTKLHTTEQPLLKRSLSSYRVAYEGATPSRLSVVQALSAKEKGTVVVSNIYTITGNQSLLVHARIYKDEAVAQAVERKNMLAKQKPKAAEGAQAEA